jgi:hypothetical protein
MNLFLNRFQNQTLILTKVSKNDRLRQCLECILNPKHLYLFFSLSKEGGKVLLVSVNWIAIFLKITQC